MFPLKVLYIFSLLIFCLRLNSQSPKDIDELKQKIASGKDDTLKIKRLLHLSNNLSSSEFKDAINYATEAMQLSEKLNYIKGKSDAYNCLADAYWFHSDYNKAQEYYFKSYRINDSIHDQKAIAFSLYNIGWILCIQQHNYKSDHYLYQSLDIYRSLKDTVGLLKIYNALASYYVDRYRNEEKEKRYFDSAIIYFDKGIECAKRARYYNDLGRIYGNLGDLFYQQRDFKTATFYNEKSLDIHRKIDDSTGIMICLLNMGLCEMETGAVNKAIPKFEVVQAYNRRHDIKDMEVMARKALAEGNFKLGNYKEAYLFFQKYSDLKEEIDRESYSANISNLQSSYSLEKSEANVEKLKQANEIQELKNKKKTYFIFGLLAIAVIVIAVALLLFRQNKQKQLTNIQLKEQNHIIAEKKLEIDNSIQYAKGIQQAVLPDLRDLENKFPDSFVYYKPKDVVSGDFYWFGEFQDEFYCIAADCTGHGVPGALMSLIGADKIVQAIFEKKIVEPGKILAFLNKQIKKVLKQHSDESKQMDGMDIALLKFNKGLSEVEFSGANRPLLIIRNSTPLEYKPDKMAIAGFTSDQQDFSTTKIGLLKGDSLYIFTDGYADQFGGVAGKKFMSKNLKELLISISGLPAFEQKQNLETALNEWKRSYEQVDDILVIGIKI